MRTSPKENSVAYSKELADASPNVNMKVGGIQMAINGFKLSSDDRDRPATSEELCELTLPYYGYVIDTFGAERCMVER